MIISDMIVTLSGPYLAQRQPMFPQRLAVTFASFYYLSKKNATKVYKIWLFFFSIFSVFCSKYLALVIKFQENQLIVLI